ILDVADLLVCALDVITLYVIRAAQVIVLWVVGSLLKQLFCVSRYGAAARYIGRSGHRISAGAPELRSDPIVTQAVVAGEVTLHLPGDRLVSIDVRARSDLLLRQIDRNRFVNLVDARNRVGGNENLTAVKPAAGFDNEITNRPLLIVEEHVFDLSQFAVGRLQTISVQAGDFT